MTRILALVFAALLPTALLAADAGAQQEDALVQPAGERELSEFLWLKRPIIVFADTPADPRYQQQIEMLVAEEAVLRDRDVIVLTDTDPKARSPIRAALRPRGFQMALVDKDGQVKLRKPRPWSVREIARTIDRTPLRLQEVEERRNSGR